MNPINSKLELLKGGHEAQASELYLRAQQMINSYKRSLQCLEMADQLNHTAWILEQRDCYAEAEKLYWQALWPLRDYIEWKQTPSGNLEVTNDTTDLYRFFDCTEAAEFLYRCVARTVTKDLPRELDYLIRRDEALRNVRMLSKVLTTNHHQIN